MSLPVHDITQTIKHPIGANSHKRVKMAQKA